MGYLYATLKWRFSCKVMVLHTANLLQVSAGLYKQMKFYSVKQFHYHVGSVCLYWIFRVCVFVIELQRCLYNIYSFVIAFTILPSCHDKLRDT